MRIFNSFPCCDCAITAATAKQGVVSFIKTMELIFALARLRVILAWAAKKGLKWLWAVHKTYLCPRIETVLLLLLLWSRALKKLVDDSKRAWTNPFFPF